MVITDKSSNSLKDCFDFVYYKLRLKNPVVDSDGSLRKVFNGISVNSWFTPMGISPEKLQTPYSPVKKDLQTKLHERAKSASAVLGRRHYEIEKQEVKRDEILQGCSMLKTKTTGIVQTSRKVKSASGRFCGTSTHSSGEVRSKILLQRPHTCHGTRTRNEEAFYTRIGSAPPSIQHVQSNPQVDTSNKSSTPLYWKTKSAYHRKQITTDSGCENSNDSECVSRGSLWKPLLYSDDNGKKHKAGCPYKCKGCFRACLVSQDYMDKVMSGKIQIDKKREKYVKPKFYHRRIVEFAIANAQPIKEMIEKNNAAKIKTSLEEKIFEYTNANASPVKIIKDSVDSARTAGSTKNRDNTE
ncbi:unnamed protein product [Mytilus edulis]|uniref:Uncharacterized protein n=1 Tax=Mytilus edulis TaxID=6550 RepID=A0A8S3QLH9_MYTED|nr:unnamed protein product [Mytilus edulis]